METQEFKKQSFVSFDKFTEEYISDVKIQYGKDSDDFIKNLITVRLKTDLYSKFVENRTITKEFKRPTFLDWLFRRKLKYTFNVKVSEVTKYVPIADNILMVEFE